MPPAFLDDRSRRLLLFGGKGGVGKTTCAAAAALRLAARDPGRRFLLVSTDPAHSLADCLAGIPTPDNLAVEELDAGAALEKFRRDNGPTCARSLPAGPSSPRTRSAS